MSGFDLPPILGFDRSFRRDPPRDAPLGQGGPEGPLPGLGGPQGPLRADGPLPWFDEGRGGEVEGPKPFDNVLADSLERVQGLQDDVREKVRGLVLGEDVELHDVMIASSKSEVAFNLLLEVRNKLVDAWEKLSRSTV